MEIEHARRNLKDFLSMYNLFTETCFERCIQNMNYRVLTPQEDSCINKCVSKLINVNHREISVYMEINPLNRRLNELGATSELQTPPPDLTKEVEKALGKDALVADDVPPPGVAGTSDSISSPTAGAITETLSNSSAEAVTTDSASQSGTQGSDVPAQSVLLPEKDSGKT